MARPLESMSDPKEPSAEERRSHTLATAGVPLGNVELRRSLWTTASLLRGPSPNRDTLERVQPPTSFARSLRYRSFMERHDEAGNGSWELVGLQVATAPVVKSTTQRLRYRNQMHESQGEIGKLAAESEDALRRREPRSCVRDSGSLRSTGENWRLARSIVGSFDVTGGARASRCLARVELWRRMMEELFPWRRWIKCVSIMVRQTWPGACIATMLRLSPSTLWGEFGISRRSGVLRLGQTRLCYCWGSTSQTYCPTVELSVASAGCLPICCSLFRLETARVEEGRGCACSPGVYRTLCDGDHPCLLRGRFHEKSCGLSLVHEPSGCGIYVEKRR